MRVYYYETTVCEVLTVGLLDKAVDVTSSEGYLVDFCVVLMRFRLRNFCPGVVTMMTTMILKNFVTRDK